MSRLSLTGDGRDKCLDFRQEMGRILLSSPFLTNSEEMLSVKCSYMRTYYSKLVEQYV